MDSSTKDRTRLNHTPLWDKERERLRRQVERPGARSDLISFIGKRNGQSDIVNGIHISKVIHGSRLPHIEFWLTVQKWLKRRK